MRRRDLLARLPLALLAIPVIGCAAEDDYPIRPPGQPIGGTSPPAGGDGIFTSSNQDDSGHDHTVQMRCSDLEDGQLTYIAEGPHQHTLTLDLDDIEDLLDGRTVMFQTTGGGHNHTWQLRVPNNICQ
jgi:hypothetical protein